MDFKNEGRCVMTKSRNIQRRKERKEIVDYCLEHDQELQTDSQSI